MAIALELPWRKSPPQLEDKSRTNYPSLNPTDAGGPLGAVKSPTIPVTTEPTVVPLKETRAPRAQTIVEKEGFLPSMSPAIGETVTIPLALLATYDKLIAANQSIPPDLQRTINALHWSAGDNPFRDRYVKQPSDENGPFIPPITTTLESNSRHEGVKHQRAQGLRSLIYNMAVTIKRADSAVANQLLGITKNILKPFSFKKSAEKKVSFPLEVNSPTKAKVVRPPVPAGTSAFFQQVAKERLDRIAEQRYATYLAESTLPEIKPLTKPAAPMVRAGLIEEIATGPVLRQAFNFELTAQREAARIFADIARDTLDAFTIGGQTDSVDLRHQVTRHTILSLKEIIAEQPEQIHPNLVTALNKEITTQEALANSSSRNDNIEAQVSNDQIQAEETYHSYFNMALNETIAARPDLEGKKLKNATDLIAIKQVFDLLENTPGLAQTTYGQKLREIANKKFTNATTNDAETKARIAQRRGRTTLPH